MVESTYSHHSNSPVSILHDAEATGQLSKVTRWHKVDLDKITEKLETFKTESHQLKHLLFKYPCLFYYICHRQGIEVDKCRQVYENMDVINNPEHMSHYILGYLLPWHDQRRRKKEIKHGSTTIDRIDDDDHFEGDLDGEGLPSGVGIAKGEFEVVEGTWLQGKDHGIQASNMLGYVRVQQYYHGNAQGYFTYYVDGI